MPKDSISDIKNKIFGNQKEYNLLDIYHHLMIHYGYMSFDDFKKMDANLVDELVIRINKMNEKGQGKGGKF